MKLYRTPEATINLFGNATKAKLERPCLHFLNNGMKSLLKFQYEFVTEEIGTLSL